MIRPASVGILVLGMHRSGTSAIAGALGRCGVELGGNLIAPAADNPLGYFEHADAVVANEVLLDALDRAWDDVRALPAGWMSTAAADAARQSVRGLLAPLAAHPVWAIKDPRMCRLLPLWLPLLAEHDIEPVGVLALRHPHAVAASLATRDGTPRRIACIAWLRHMLEAAAHAPERTSVLRYDDLVADPVAAMQGLAKRLALPIQPDADALRPFVDPNARHHACVEAVEGDDPWDALAIDVFSAFEGEGAWRTRLPQLQSRFEALAAADAAWLEVTGQVQRAADRRRRQDFEARIATEARAEALQAALDRASATAQRHLDALRSEASRVVEAERALEQAEALAHTHLDESVQLARRLAETQQALARAEALAAARAADVDELTAQVARTEQAKAEAEALAAARSADVAELTAQVARTEQAKAEAEGMVSGQLVELACLHAAKDEAERLAYARLDEVHDLAGRLESTRRALEAAQLRLSALADRLSAIESARGWRMFARLSGIEPGRGDA